MEASDLQTLIGDKLLINEGEGNKSITYADWHAKFSPKGEYICFYFGAHWAPPCRIFTTQLAEKLYTECNKDG